MSGAALKLRFIFLAIFSCSLLAVPAHAKKRHSVPVQPATPEPAAAPAPPPTLADMPASPPQVSFQGGQLTISAQNSTLGDILKAVRTQTGATIDFPGNATERVVGHFGPAPARDVLTVLLNGSHFNYVLLGSPADPNTLDRVILMAKSGAPAESSPAPTQQANATPPAFNRPAAMPMAAPMGGVPGGNSVVVEGQEAQDEATDDSADATDDTQADDQSVQTEESDDQAADEQQQQQQEGQQGVKTPEQLLQELQQRQQQIQQQQGIQPGVPPGVRQFPNPGMPGQPGDGTNPPPPHN